MKLSILLLLALVGTALSYKSYAGYQVFETAILTEKNIVKLAPLMENPMLDFWSTPRVGRRAAIMVPPTYVVLLKDILTSYGLEPTVLIPDVEVVVQKEREDMAARRRDGRAPDLTDYQTFEEIQAYLAEVVATYPSIATLITIGLSYEGRPLNVLKLSNGPGKAGIWMESAVHAREWAGPPTLLYSINELTENLANNQAMLDSNDFYFLPVGNPDGYSYTFTNERLWRKTREPNTNCYGTDMNRNYDYAWAGGSNAQCGETYHGTSPFSAPETQAIRDFLINNPSITFFLDVHSYGQWLLYPYGDKPDMPPTVADLEAVGGPALAALEAVRGTVYTMGSTYNLLYQANGLGEDWCYEILRLAQTWVIELPSGGQNGFDPPASDIGPVTTETWEAYKVFAANIPPARGHP